ncbi:MAG: pyridine nucleotide-disulfide oxidoreductase, partial [Bilophila sp.]|nr:pyridine nucleotide-disulfide oxidoreductase [Bilophila sp.]
IDAVATMLQFGKPTIDDLANAEIAYAPPFASAMDAVNAVANVADNILSGQLKPISSKEFGELWKDRANNNVFFADARPAVAGNATAAKYPGEWHAIALEDIEAKFDSIPKDRPVALVCNTGLRSYEVMLYLHNHGVTDVVNALGGMQALIKRGDNM